MITVCNEFEVIPAFEVVASGETLREITIELIDVLHKVSQEDTAPFWERLAREYDEDTDEMEEIQQDVALLIQDIAPIPASCGVSLQNGEWIVLPFIDEDSPRLGECPDEFTEDDIVYVVSDHGNVTCYEWQYIGEPGGPEYAYTEIWGMV